MNKKYFINYICEVNFPNTSAYGLHVLKMCDAFSSRKYKVNLFIPSLSINQYLLKKNYIIKNKINFLTIFKNKKKINFLTRIIFVFRIINNKTYNNKKAIFLTRSPLFGIIGSFFNIKIILELHHELSGMTKFLYYGFKKINLLQNLSYIFLHKNLIEVFKPNKDKYICLDDCVDPNDFKFKNKLNKFKNSCVYIGSFHPGKGIELICEIANKLKNVNFHLYGDKQFLSPNYKLLSNIKIFDYVDYKMIPKILSKYKIALMPYANKVSGRLKDINLANSMSPLKMFDYLASSIIIIASDLKSYNHILKHKYNSILVDNSNIDKWVDWINKILFTKNNFSYLKKNSYKTSLKYTWKKRSDKIIQFANKQFSLN